jgi:alpha-galactosidase
VSTGLLHLREAGVSLLLQTHDDRLPVVLHWGRDLGGLDGDELGDLALGLVPGVPHSALDAPAPVELLPQPARGYAGRGALRGSRTTQAPVLLLDTVDVTREGSWVTVLSQDGPGGVAVLTEVGLTPEGLLRARHVVTNVGDDALDLAALPVRLPLPSHATDLLDLTGRWGRERIPQRGVLRDGAWVREQRRGRPGHDSPLLLLAGTPGFGFRSGEVWGLHVAWSGDTELWAERLPEGIGGVGGGELLAPGEVQLAPGEQHASPWVVAAYSPRGLDALSHRFHDHLRGRPRHPRSPRPVVLNTWEAVYFDHDLDRLRSLADRAAGLGVERFVLDDGWFLGRRDDTRGLGDWTVDPDVWPEGLAPLIDHVRDLGMEFGLWVEPEMVNLDSELARAHPDWLLALPERVPPPWRHQHVLDLARPEVRAHLLARLSALLNASPIAYLKWDHNRDLVDAHHGQRPGVHAQTAGALTLLAELKARHPDVEIESCASGGGRVDLAVLEHTDRVWASDCTDALERQEIQRWTGLLLPPELVGAHVSAPRNHQTGRVLDLSFRAGTALFGHFGIEWDVSTADDDELAALARWVAAYKQLRPLLHSGDVVRSDHTDPGRLVHGVVARDRGEAVYAVVQLTSPHASLPSPVPLPGLDPDRVYDVQPLAPGDDPRTLQVAGPPWWAEGTVHLPGSVLTDVGAQVPLLAPEQLVLLRVTERPAVR